MRNTRNWTLAALTALSIGVGTAVAQESPGGADVNSQPAFGSTAPVRHASPVAAQPAAGSSEIDRTQTNLETLLGGDGNAG